MILYQVNQGITEQEIQEYLPVLETEVNGKIPDALIEIWKKHNGFHGVDENEDIDGHVWFYSITDCIDFNQYKYIPGYLIIADEDGGGLVVMMKLGAESEEIFTNTRSPFFSMELKYLENTGFTLKEWHKLGCYTCFGHEPVELDLGEARAARE